MTKEEFEVAQQKVLNSVVKQNYMKIILSYSTEIILTYDKGVALLEALSSAEMLSSNGIVPLNEYVVRTEIMSPQLYIDYKMSTLLNIPIKEILEMKKDLDLT